jgi:hypothetical protein
MVISARHRNKNGEIGRKHGNILVGTLRKRMVAASLFDAAMTKSSAMYCTRWTTSTR